MNTDILFPVLNERLRLENGIRNTIHYITANRDRLGDSFFNLIIVDNGSDDETPEIAKALVDEFANSQSQGFSVRYIRLEERGVGIAFRSGVEAGSSEIVGYMDIDLSTDIDNLSTMLKIFETRPEVVYVNASRFAKESVVTGRKWYRKITSKGLLIILKGLLKMKSTDAICGFTFVRRKQAEALVRQCSNDKGWFYMIEFLLRAERAGMNIVDLPVRWREDYNTTVNVVKTVKNYLKNIHRLRRDFKREDRRHA